MIEKTGMMMGGVAAVEFLEMLPDNIPEEVKDDDFCEEYERMLNRVRYEVRKSVPVAPKITEPVSKKYSRFYSCGQCGHDITPGYFFKYCPDCGRKIKWKAVFPERAV